jgi:hypothetical protein
VKDQQQNVIQSGNLFPKPLLLFWRYVSDPDEAKWPIALNFFTHRWHSEANCCSLGNRVALYSL